MVDLLVGGNTEIGDNKILDLDSSGDFVSNLMTTDLTLDPTDEANIIDWDMMTLIERMGYTFDSSNDVDLCGTSADEGFVYHVRHLQRIL